MCTNTPPLPEGFKRQMVKLAMADRSPVAQSRKFRVCAQSITAWVARAAVDTGKPVRGKVVLSTVECVEQVVRTV